jgi:hypothetical protein
MTSLLVTTPRGLSVRQPWASLIGEGKKTIEIRSWSTSYRGPLLICSGSKPWKGNHGHSIGPLGVSICLVELVNVRPFEERDVSPSCVPRELIPDGALFSWELRLMREVREVRVSGRLNLFRLDELTLKSIDL